MKWCTYCGREQRRDSNECPDCGGVKFHLQSPDEGQWKTTKTRILERMLQKPPDAFQKFCLLIGACWGVFGGIAAVAVYPFVLYALIAGRFMPRVELWVPVITIPIGFCLSVAMYVVFMRAYRNS